MMFGIKTYYVGFEFGCGARGERRLEMYGVDDDQGRLRIRTHSQFVPFPQTNQLYVLCLQESGVITMC